ncbi:MAG: phosphoribosylglycinamide formyltransferase [Gemmataceae bacterium]
MKRPLRLGVLLSGSGSTLQNLIDHIADGKLPARIQTVISSKDGVLGIDRARQAHLPVHVVTRKSCSSAEEFSKKVLGYCEDVDLVCMAGFLQFLPVPEAFIGRVMNIHPALLPAFGGKGFHGLHVHQAALECGVKFSGCTVHFADNEYDHGPIILQKVVPVLDEDTPESLQQRVFAAECEAYPEAIRLFGEGRLQIVGRRVRVHTSRQVMRPG